MSPAPTSTRIRREGERFVLPGLATAHSHAFQRALRGRTQRKQSVAGSFWSWRGLMYELAAQLDPEAIYALSRLAYAELAMAGVTAVGEFHYVHHDKDGTPYDDRVEMGDAVIRAAVDVGVRVTLLRVLYHQADMSGREPEGAQRRFSDGRLEDALTDVSTLLARYDKEPLVSVGVAPHSVRAVPRAWWAEASGFAAERDLPLHAHLAEQRREVEECLQATGLRPVALVAEEGVLDDRFVAVHATHLDADEPSLLGSAGAFVCICRTTERDLGDGLAHAAALVTAGARLCTGVDSHAVSDPFEEARAIELDDRSRAEARAVAAEGPELFDAASREGYAAIGMAGRHTEDRVTLDANDPSLALTSDATLEDAVVFGATPRAVREVTVAGRTIVEEGLHPDWDHIRSEADGAMRRLGLL